jgi:hypothetical protein
LGKFRELKVNKSELIKELQECQNLVFCSHDAGGAELLSSFIVANNLLGKFLVSGPATKVFQSKNLLSEVNQLTFLQADASIILSSTGTTDFEYSNMLAGSKNGAKVIALLDHWVNYTGRFERRGRKIESDLILVVDEYAFKIAEKEFPKTEIVLIDNDFLEGIKKEYCELDVKNIEYDYVFMCESRHANANMEQSIEINNLAGLVYFFDFLSSLGKNDARILLRPHPSDLVRDYTEYVPKNFPLVKISAEESLLKTLKTSQIVVGCNSMALVIALTIGKRVYSACKNPKPVLLPFAGIRPLSEINQ